MQLSMYVVDKFITDRYGFHALLNIRKMRISDLNRFIHHSRNFHFSLPLIPQLLKRVFRSALFVVDGGKKRDVISRRQPQIHRLFQT